MSAWNEERRADRAAEREQDRQDRRLAAEEARKNRRDREKAQERRREQRRQRRTALREALAAQIGQVPWLVIMGAPMVLSWTAMARYGTEVYGPVGVLLPLFSEAALLVFALVAARAAQRGEPTAVLRLGTAVFALVTAALNYIHGASGDGGSVTQGVVMAVVAVGGVAVHQIVHARQPRPRRTRTQRQADRLARLHQRRVIRLQRAAVRVATPVLASDGTVHLVHRAGEVTEKRTLLRRTRVVPAAAPSQGDRLAEEIESWLSAGAPETARVQGGPAETHPERDRRDQDPDQGPSAPAEQPQPEDEDLIRRVLAAVADGLEPTNENVRVLLRCRKDRAYRVARAARARLHNGGEGDAVRI